ATAQEPYEQAARGMFETLDWIETTLSHQAHLLGERQTEADWRLFPTLVRFDCAYYPLFKCNLRHIYEYPAIWRYTKRLYAVPGIAAAVDGERRARDEARLIRGQEQHRAGDLLGLRMPLERNELVEECGRVTPENLAQVALDIRLEPILCRAGMDSVHANAPRGDFLGHRAHESDLGVLRRDVRVGARTAHQTDDARGDDDAAAVVHAGNAVLASEERPLHVHAVHLVEHVLRIRGDRADCPGIAGVAEDH